MPLVRQADGQSYFDGFFGDDPTPSPDGSTQAPVTPSPQSPSPTLNPAIVQPPKSEANQFYDLPLEVYNRNLDYNPETNDGTMKYKSDPCTGKRSKGPDGNLPDGCTGADTYPLICHSETMPCTCDDGYQPLARPGFLAPADGDGVVSERWKMFKATTNHCSDPTGRFDNSNEKVATCCDGHDFCYGAAFTTKQECDNAWARCLEKNTEMSWVMIELGVRALQMSYFVESQQYAIECRQMKS